MEDLTFVTGERSPGSGHWQEVQDLCAERLDELDFDVERVEFAAGVNVIGTMVGYDAPDEQVVVGAHYDHLEGCDGADDNATGVAGALELARMLGDSSHARTLVIACWDQEEIGLLGSMKHAAELAMTGSQVETAISLEMIGYASDQPDTQQIPPGFPQVFPDEVARVEGNDRRGDFITLIGDTDSVGWMRDFATAAEGVDLPTVVLEASVVLGPVIANLVRSDHASFWAAGLSGVMVTDTANFRNPNYHCSGGPDTVDVLDHDFAGKVVEATAEAALRSLNP